MGRRLSLLCCPCLPRKQRDNLSSRSLYPDQDSSGHDDYSDDDDNDYNHHHHHYPSYARLEALAPAPYTSSSTSAYPSFRNNSNPWPSSFSNGRFSKQSSRGNSQRKSNPFRTPYHDDDDDGDGDEDGDNYEGGQNGIGSEGKGQGRGSVGVTSFAPYRDDSDSDEGERERENRRRLRREQQPKNGSSGSGSGSEPKDESNCSSSGGNGNGNGSALQNPTRIYPKMEVSPYRVFDSTTTATATMRRPRPPRNPQGKMHWRDGKDDDDDIEDGEADAEEVIDVDALIAEQDRITRELAAQEEALRQEEESAILSKRLAAIRAAETRGLLRFEGDQLVIHNSDKSTISATDGSNGVAIPSQENNNNRQGPHRQLARERTTSSEASSFVGGIDAFNQELKMMDLDMRASRDADKSTSQSITTTAATKTSTTSTTSTSTSTSTNTGPSIRRTISTGVSTSTSTSTSSSPTVINPREVFNNITSFLKKVDGVIAGEGDSSDEAAFSDQEQALGKGRTNHARGPQENNRVHGPEETGASEPEPKLPSVETPSTVQRAMTPIPFDAANQEDDDDEQPYPADPFNMTQPSVDARNSQLSKEQTTPGSPVAVVEKETSNKIKPEPAATPAPSAYAPLSGAVAAVVPERIIGTFTSLFNSGSSFMGLWGTGGGGGQQDGHDDDDGVSADGRRLSSLKYGDPKKHRFNYQDHHNNSASATTGRSVAKHADDDDSSIDDYDF
ncbi:hypothetical protein BGX29_012210 [Mortierella sp. GBA35]|nr:hypothetical protein BGX29_012210 [Mortierella sp. GBA35]